MKLPKIPALNRIKRWWKSHRWLDRLESWASSHSLPGFFKVPIYDVVVFLFNEFRRYDLITRANSIAFSFFLSLFPSLLTIFTLLPYLKHYFIRYLPEGEDFELILRTEIHKIMPGIAGERVFMFIDDITSKPRTGLLSFGFFLTLFFASNGMIALIRGFEKSYMHTYKKRNFFRKRLVAISLILFVSGLLVLSVILLLLGNFMITELAGSAGMDRLEQFLLNAVRWIAIIALFYTGIAIIYRYGAPLRERLRFFTPGAALATLLCLLASVVFSAYVNNFNTYNRLYGSIGTIIVLMLWMQLNALALLIGYELNASIAVNRNLKEEIDETEAIF